MGNKAIKMPLRVDAERCLAIRRRGKRGIYSSQEEHEFCAKMFKEYGEWFSKTEARIFNETVPFGSQAFITEEPLPPYADELAPKEEGK